MDFNTQMTVKNATEISAEEAYRRIATFAVENEENIEGMPKIQLQGLMEYLELTKEK